MSTVLLNVLLGIGLLLVAALALVLLVPIDVDARGSLPGPSGAVMARWGGGLLGVRLASSGPGEVRLVGYRVARLSLGGWSKPRSEKRKRSGSWRPGLRTILRLVRRAVRSLGLRTRIRGRIGLGDPAETANVYLALVALRRLVPGVDTRGLAVDWIDPVADVEGTVEGRVWPLAILWIALTETLTTNRRG